MFGVNDSVVQVTIVVILALCTQNQIFGISNVGTGEVYAFEKNCHRLSQK